MNPAYVGGVGLCAPRCGGTASWSAAFPGLTPSDPSGDLLPPVLRRRASSLARMAAAVVGQAANQAGLDLARVPLVLGSAHGEIVAAVEMMREFGGTTGLPSPTRFHNSVHNASAAYLSIATGNHGFNTAVAAGRATPAATLLEAMALLREHGGDALLIVIDEPPPEPFAPANPYPAAAVAICLSTSPGPDVLAAVSLPRRGPAPCADLPEGLAFHPCAGAFALLAAILSRRPATVGLGTDGVGPWFVDVAPVA